MENLNLKRVLITGASSGIGEAMAFSLASKGCEIFLLARRKDKLKGIRDRILQLYPQSTCHIISIDVNDPHLNDVLVDLTGKKLDILINNAGLARGRDTVMHSQLSDWEEMIATNIVANFKLIHMVLPWMRDNGGGDIINLCSVAGHYTYAGGAVYCATKHAVKAFTRSLREETCGQNIRVMQISPGMVETDFSRVRFRGDEEASQKVYEGMTPLTPHDIARMMIFMLESPRHVVIDEIITMPREQGSPTTVFRRNL
jgi:NADP-dependent 3-hydroxy acid dehydrogenase YdfG